jgi:hypothetical protein
MTWKGNDPAIEFKTIEDVGLYPWLELLMEAVQLCRS